MARRKPSNKLGRSKANPVPGGQSVENRKRRTTAHTKHHKKYK